MARLTAIPARHQMLTWDQAKLRPRSRAAPATACQARQALHGARVAAGAAGCQRGGSCPSVRGRRASPDGPEAPRSFPGSGTPARRHWHRHRSEPDRQDHARSRVQITQAGMQVRRSRRQRTADQNGGYAHCPRLGLTTERDGIREARVTPSVERATCAFGSGTHGLNAESSLRGEAGQLPATPRCAPGERRRSCPAARLLWWPRPACARSSGSRSRLLSLPRPRFRRRYRRGFGLV